MDLFQNPFFLIGVTTRADRRRIIELAEEKSLLSESEGWTEARSILTNPRKRLAAEIAWLIGLAPKRVKENLILLKTDPLKIGKQENLPHLARANLLTAGFVRTAEILSTNEIVKWLVDLAETYDNVDPESILILINEERGISRFPEISDLQAIKAELEGLRQYFRRAIKEALDRLPTEKLVHTITQTIEMATEGGTIHAPLLIDDIIDSFEIEAKYFFELETKNILSLISQIQSTLENDSDENVVLRLIVKLEKVVRNWDLVAQPIQVNYRSRGLEHGLSHEVAGKIRSLSIELYNDYGFLELTKRLTILLEEVFAEVDAIAEKTEEDSHTLKEISEQRIQYEQEAKEQSEAWKKEITFEAELGAVFKSKLSISPEGVNWKEKRWPLESITRVRWGATKHSVNGIPTGTTYGIFIGTGSDGTNIALKKGTVYSEFISRLWKSVGIRLLTKMLEELREGRRIQFGSAVVDDFGIELERRRVFSANERIHYGWMDLVIGNRPGAFYIAEKNGEKVSVELSYDAIDNVHVLEAAMRILWEGAQERISSLLSKD